MSKEIENPTMKQFFAGREHMKDDPCVIDLMKLFQAKIRIADKWRKRYIALENKVTDEFFTSSMVLNVGQSPEQALTRIMNYIEADQ